MKKTKKWLAVLLAGSMIMAGGMSVTASAAEVTDVAVSGADAAIEPIVVAGVQYKGNYGYVITSYANKTATVVDYKGNESTVNVPKSVVLPGTNSVPTTFKVTAIGSLIGANLNAFANCSATRIIIQDNIDTIGGCTFFGCENLIRVDIPKNVTKIADTAFFGCDKVKIYGERNTEAERFANAHNIPFVDINQKPIYGDVDGDGVITSNDAQMILMASMDMVTLTAAQKKAADVNCDGSILSDDAINVLRYSAGYNVTGTKIGQEIK